MINLIPREKKKILAINFYYRLIVLLFLMLSLNLLILCIFLMPSYIVSLWKANEINTKLEIQKSEQLPSVDRNALAIIENTNVKLDLIENSKKTKFLVSEKVISSILLRKISSVKITQMSYLNEGAQKIKVIISGIASSREALLLFRQSLEADISFKKIDLPISNFVKGSNIKFSLTLIPS